MSPPFTSDPTEGESVLGSFSAYFPCSLLSADKADRYVSSELPRALAHTHKRTIFLPSNRRRGERDGEGWVQIVMTFIVIHVLIYSLVADARRGL